MSTVASTVLQNETEVLTEEINSLRKQLNYEKQQHKHWEELAMIFHDALWKELKLSHSRGMK